MNLIYLWKQKQNDYARPRAMTLPKHFNEIETIEFLTNVVFAKATPKWIKNQAQSHLKNPNKLEVGSAEFLRMAWGLNADGEPAMINGKWNPSQ